MKETLAAIAAVLAIIGNVPYIIDIFKGRVQPHAYTWFVWTLVTGIVFFGQTAKGAGIGALPTAASGVFTLFIFFLSLKNGLKHITKIDTFFSHSCFGRHYSLDIDQRSHDLRRDRS